MWLSNSSRGAEETLLSGFVPTPAHRAPDGSSATCGATPVRVPRPAASAAVSKCALKSLAGGSTARRRRSSGSPMRRPPRNCERRSRAWKLCSKRSCRACQCGDLDGRSVEARARRMSRSVLGSKVLMAHLQLDRACRVDAVAELGWRRFSAAGGGGVRTARRHCDNASVACVRRGGDERRASMRAW